MPRYRIPAALALIATLAAASAAPAPAEADPPAPAAPGPFVRAGNLILNVGRVDVVEVRKLEGRTWLRVTLAGRPEGSIQLRAEDAAEFLRALGQPPIEPAAP